MNRSTCHHSTKEATVLQRRQHFCQFVVRECYCALYLLRQLMYRATVCVIQGEAASSVLKTTRARCTSEFVGWNRGESNYGASNLTNVATYLLWYIGTIPRQDLRGSIQGEVAAKLHWYPDISTLLIHDVAVNMLRRVILRCHGRRTVMSVRLTASIVLSPSDRYLKRSKLASIRLCNN